MRLPSLIVGLAVLGLVVLAYGESDERSAARDRIDRQWQDFLNAPATRPADPAPRANPLAKPATADPLERPAANPAVGVAAIEKYLSPNASYVLFKPKDWKVREGGDGELKTVAVTDLAGEIGIHIIHGAVADDVPGETVAGLYLRGLAQTNADLSISTAFEKKGRYALVVTYTNAKKQAREQRIWTSVQDGNILVIAADTPAGQYNVHRGTLLSIASNFRPLKDATPRRSALVGQKLKDGSATLAIPQGWNLIDQGKGCFIATGPDGNGLFMSAVVTVMDPKWAGNIRNVPVAPYTTPGEAFKMLVVGAGLADEMKLMELKPREDLVREGRQVLAGRGPLNVEEFQWISRKGQKRTHGFTLGITGGSEVGVNWSLIHITIAAPEADFAASLPTMAAIYSSFRVDKQWSDTYVREGKKKLQEMQRQTAEIIHRNAQEIREINTAIYENKSRSQDYLSYAWSQTIRGESDWISGVEGGTVYRSDSWGLTNTSTGDFYEGRNWDYTQFEGDNPKYRERMQEANSRELYEKYVKGQPRR